MVASAIAMVLTDLCEQRLRSSQSSSLHDRKISR
jgi:hypothetical protein